MAAATGLAERRPTVPLQAVQRPACGGVSAPQCGQSIGEEGPWETSSRRHYGSTGRGLPGVAWPHRAQSMAVTGTWRIMLCRVAKAKTNAPSRLPRRRLPIPLCTRIALAEFRRRMRVLSSCDLPSWARARSAATTARSWRTPDTTSPSSRAARTSTPSAPAASRSAAPRSATSSCSARAEQDTAAVGHGRRRALRGQGLRQRDRHPRDRAAARPVVHGADAAERRRQRQRARRRASARTRWSAARPTSRRRSPRPASSSRPARTGASSSAKCSARCRG